MVPQFLPCVQVQSLKERCDPSPLLPHPAGCSTYILFPGNSNLKFPKLTSAQRALALLATYPISAEHLPLTHLLPRPTKRQKTTRSEDPIDWDSHSDSDSDSDSSADEALVHSQVGTLPPSTSGSTSSPSPGPSQPLSQIQSTASVQTHAPLVQTYTEDEASEEVTRVLALLPSALVKVASQPIVRGASYEKGGVSGNVRGVVLARKLVYGALREWKGGAAIGSDGSQGPGISLKAKISRGKLIEGENIQVKSGVSATAGVSQRSRAARKEAATMNEGEAAPSVSNPETEATEPSTSKPYQGLIPDDWEDLITGSVGSSAPQATGQGSTATSGVPAAEPEPKKVTLDDLVVRVTGKKGVYGKVEWCPKCGSAI